ncbi:YqhG family protein [Bacillus sp. 03113]|uniref:YqhG family protein n=1 Tax=Bacillus sp. 03113 TaxID=2578211 RepID=UPI0011430D23|nr:YqhG family protein [Bacillus sp. 03113]
MQQHEINQFLERYFMATGCEITENGPGYMTVQLTNEMDKELMNRPFYWHYLEKTGGTPNPMMLTLITNPGQAPEHIKGEVIHFGSPRLHQIFQSTKRLGGYIRLYEDHPFKKGQNTPLKPWLGLNMKISYQCDRKKDVFKSLGLQLINGQIVEDFFDKLQLIKLTPKIPDFSFTLTPLIMPKSGITRMKRQLTIELDQEDHQWAEDARMRWKQDLELLEKFYEDTEEKGGSYENEKTALKDQYEPKITMSVLNGGMFYLTENAI